MSDRLLPGSSHEPIITLTTDFGVHDPFVGIMKGVILSINPNVRIIDLCHYVPAHRILEASFLLGSSYRFFPAGTIHVVVVDPGVGSQRRPILAQGKNCYFVAPDNGVLSYPYREERADLQVFHLTRKEYFQPHVSQTFHGRDIFAPVSAWLSTGLAPHLFGPGINDYLELEIPEPRCLAPHIYEFQIIHIDAFGNLITSIGQDFFSRTLSQGKGERFSLELASQTITCLQTHYAALDQSSRIGAIFGSTGNLEIFANRASASKTLHVSVGDTGKITFLT
ncbi:MAG: SAM-dependent chlorinase/fluorinase [bacterium]